MTNNDEQVIKIVYERFLESESDSDWGNLDENLEFFDWLNDKELINEAKIKLIKHKKGKIFRCTSPHNQEDCFAPFILQAVTLILELWDKTRILDNKNRYVLLYYVSMSEMKLIFEA